MVKDPPTYSCDCSCPSFALAAKDLTLSDIPERPSVFEFRMIGVIRPVEVATATQISDDAYLVEVKKIVIYVLYYCRMNVSCHDELTVGTFCRARADALIIKSLTDNLNIPFASAFKA